MFQRRGFQQPGEGPQLRLPRVGRVAAGAGQGPVRSIILDSLPPEWTSAADCSSAPKWDDITVRQSPLARLPASQNSRSSQFREAVVETAVVQLSVRTLHEKWPHVQRYRW